MTIDKKNIGAMFDSIAPHYDFLNHFLSLNIDRSWRFKLEKTVKKSGAAEVLDLACGTGDVSRGLYRKGINVTGMDISPKMLEIAAQKSRGMDIRYMEAAADNIPFDDNSFDAVTISFGIRNFDNRRKCINEIYRVMRDNGTLAILEFTIPKNKLWKAVYSFYFLKVLPAIGRIISKQNYAYTYLPKSTFEFPQREVFCEELRAGHFKDVYYKSLTGGVACLYIGKK